jgi:hypothetical protein
MYDVDEFNIALKRLISDQLLRQTMGARAAVHVRHRHDLQNNYHELEKRLKKIVSEKKHVV